MTNTTKKTFLLALALTGAFLLLCTGFYTYELLSAYSPESGHFAQDAFSGIFLPLLYIVAIIAFLVFGILFRASLTGRLYKNVLSVLFASGFAAIATAIWLLTFLFRFIGTAHTLPSTLFGILLIVFALAAITYFVLSATPTPSQTHSVITGLGTALFVLVYAFYAYFDTAFTLNSPIKLLDQVSAIALMLFFLIETRFRLGGFSEAVLFPVGMTAFLLSASNGISALIYHSVEGRPLVVHMMHDFLFLGLSIYVLARLISFLLPPLFQEEEKPESELSPSFETENAPTPIAQDLSSPAQETFDFDEVAEPVKEEPAVPAEAPTEESEEEPTEAALDFDTPNEVDEQ